MPLHLSTFLLEIKYYGILLIIFNSHNFEHKKSKFLSSLTFFLRFRDNALFPTILKSSIIYPHILFKISSSLLREHIQSTNREVDFIASDLLNPQILFSNILASLDLSLWREFHISKSSKRLSLPIKDIPRNAILSILKESSHPSQIIPKQSSSKGLNSAVALKIIPR